MPKGTAAPGKVLPSFWLPMKGLTRSVRWPSDGSAARAAGVASSADAAITPARHSRGRRVPLMSDDLRRFDIVVRILRAGGREPGDAARIARNASRANNGGDGTLSGKEARTMPKVSRETATQGGDYGPAIDHSEDLEPYTVDFLMFREDVDHTPLLRGLPDHRCQCPHWGYVL